MDLPRGLTLAMMGLLVAAIALFFVAGAFGGWTALGLLVLVYGLVAVGGLVGAAAIVVAARSRHHRIQAGVAGTRATIGLTALIAVLLVGFAAFSDAPVAWRILAAAVASVDGIAVLLGLKKLGGAQVAQSGR